MSVFGDIMHKIFHQSPSEETHYPHTQPVPAPGTGPAAPESPVNVTTILQNLAQQSTEPLDWQHSIVDLMKLLDLDSSLPHRQELAKELNYTGNMDDTARMNTWLHMEVIKRLTEHHGRVPDELKK